MKDDSFYQDAFSKLEYEQIPYKIVNSNYRDKMLSRVRSKNSVIERNNKKFENELNHKEITIKKSDSIDNNKNNFNKEIYHDCYSDLNHIEYYENKSNDNTVEEHNKTRYPEFETEIKHKGCCNFPKCISF